MATYSLSGNAYTDKTDNVDTILAAHMNAVQDEIEIIESILSGGTADDLDLDGTFNANVVTSDGDIIAAAQVEAGVAEGTPPLVITSTTLVSNLNVDMVDGEHISKSNKTAEVAPTVDDDSGEGYSVGSLWIDVTADIAYICLDATVGAAVWRGVYLLLDEDDMASDSATAVASQQSIKKYVDDKHPEEMIFGVSWDKSDDPTLTRTDDAVGFTAEVGVDGSTVTNDFDDMPIFGDMEEFDDKLGNTFVRIPKFYIKKTDGVGSRTWQVSKTKHDDDWYLPSCFWDFGRMIELPYVFVGKHLGHVDGGALQSIPNVYPTVDTSIENFRTAAEANNTGGLSGYQQMDIHVYNMLQVLFYVEFATLDSQAIMRGFTEGQWSSEHTLTADTSPAGNTLVVTNATGALYEVGQAISVGTSLGGNQRFYGRTITAIDADTPAAGSTTITFDGAAVELFTDDILYNTGMKTGFGSAIAASSGSVDSNSSGKHSFIYRGIESLYGDIWQFVDGVNITDNQAWVCKDADDYVSDVFASPYEELTYVNHNENGYAVEMGLDSDLPFVEFPTSVEGGDSSKFYCDYYYQKPDQRIALVGGFWYYGLYAGLTYWHLYFTSSIAQVYIGARLLKKAL